LETLNAIIIGATGATGTSLIEQLIDDPNFEKVLIFARNPPQIKHDKLVVKIVDFNKIDNWKNEIKGDVLFSAMGTTLKEAGSKINQYEVDFTYQNNVALAAAGNNVEKLILVSSVGANSSSRFFYPKIKGQLEDAIKLLKFKTIYVLQPPVLVRQKDKMRSNEKTGIKIIKSLNKIGLLKSQKPLEITLLAKKMIFLAQQEPNENYTVLKPSEILTL
jgi:hypothetical protein